MAAFKSMIISGLVFLVSKLGTKIKGNLNRDKGCPGSITVF